MIISSKPYPNFTKLSAQTDQNCIENFKFFRLGRYALLSAMLNLGLKKGDSIIIPAYMCESAIKPLETYGFNLVYIDDLGVEKMYADIVINHALNLNINDFDSAEFTKFALGSEYAVMRPKFINAAKKTRKLW